MLKFFPPTQSLKDGEYRIRVVKSTEGPLGNLVEKTGFLKFNSEDKANLAYETLEAGDVNLAFSDKGVITDRGILYDITVVGIKSAVEHE